MNNQNNKISNSEELDNLYLKLYKKRIEKISLDIKTNSLIRDEKNLNIQKRKLVRNKIYIILFRLLASLITCLLLIGYISVLINIIPLLISISKTVHIVSITVGVLSISILSSYLTAKIENKFKSKIKEKQNKLSKEIEKKTNEINLNKEDIKDMDIEIENIIKEITKLEQQEENKVETINKCNNIQEIDKFKENTYVRKRTINSERS